VSLGYALFCAAAGELRRTGKDRAFLWFLDINDIAIRSHARLGGAEDRPGIRHATIGGQDVRVITVRYALSRDVIQAPAAGAFTVATIRMPARPQSAKSKKSQRSRRFAP